MCSLLEIRMNSRILPMAAMPCLRLMRKNVMFDHDENAPVKRILELIF